jgi:hypothetical protein
MDVDVIDMEDPAVGRDVRTRLDARRVSSTKITMYGMCNGVGQMIQDITSVAPRGGVGVLRIWSHGRPGGQTVSGGHAGETGRVQDWTGISVANIDALQDQLVGLNAVFAPGARVELRGCSVAGGAPGEELLQRLARLWGVTVQGGTVVQSGIDWVPPVVQAGPSGAMSCTMGVNP